MRTASELEILEHDIITSIGPKYSREERCLDHFIHLHHCYVEWIQKRQGSPLRGELRQN